MRNAESFLDRLPPQDIEAERCVLGGILLANESIDDVTGIIKASHFYMDAHRRLFRAMSEMYQAGHRGIDAVTLRDELTRRGELDLIGGVKYLLQLMEVVPNAFNAAYYAGLVKETWTRRAIIEAATESLKEAYHGHAESRDILSTVDSRFRDIERGDNRGAVDVPAVVQATFDKLADRMANGTPPDYGLPTGWRCVDDLIGGIKRGWLFVIAARPSVGKTGIAGAIAQHNAKIGNGVMMFSLEMSGEELALRIVSCQSRVPANKIEVGHPDEIEQFSVYEAVQEIKRWPLEINEQAGVLDIEVASEIRRAVANRGIKLIIIDHLQFVEPSDKKQPREQQVSSITRRMKLTAKEEHVPIILLCQLNRKISDRKDKTPILTDLRESGSIEQDADVVMLLHRPDIDDPEDRPNEVDAIIRKNRHGPIGTATLTFDKSIMRYRDAGEFEKPSEEF